MDRGGWAQTEPLLSNNGAAEISNVQPHIVHVGENGHGFNVPAEREFSFSYPEARVGRDSDFSTGNNFKEYFEEKHDMQRASRSIEDAFLGVKRVHPLQTQEAQWWYILHLRMYYVLGFLVWGYVLLTFFERPLWCIRLEEQLESDPCKDSNYPTFNFPFLPRWGDLLLEFCFLSTLGFNLYVESMAYGRRLYENNLNVAYAVLLVLALGDLIYAYATPWSWFRFAPYIRIAILTVRQKDIQSTLLVIYRIMPAFGSICVLFGLFLFLFAWCGCIMFPEDSVEKEIFFPNLWGAMWTLMILLTTNNSPNMFMPSFKENRLSMLYYATFSLLVLFFGLNMITAIIYKEYNASRTRSCEEKLEARRANLRYAFKLLDKRGIGKVDSKKMMEVFWEMNNNSEIAYIAEDRAKLLFAAADTDGDNMLDEEEFMSICDVLRVRFEEVKSAKPLEERFPLLYQKRWFRAFCNFVNGQLFEWIIDFLLMVNAVLVALESSDPLGFKGLDYGDNTFTSYIELLFSMLFVVEVIIKVFVNSWPGYWEKASNKFDFLVTVATVLASLYVYYPNAYNNSNLVRWFQVLRILRAVRFLARMEGFKAICVTFAKMLGPASRLLKVMFIIMFVFSALGMQIFGGRLTWDPKSRYYKDLKEKAPDFTFPDPRYDFIALNFNDMWTGFVTLLVFLVVNNWDAMVEGFIAVTNPWLRVFFVAFHFLGVYLCLNIATSFIIDTAMELYSEGDRPTNVIDGMAEIVGNEAVFEAEVVAGDQTGLKGKYRAVINNHGDMAEDGHTVMNRIFLGRSKSIRSMSRMEGSSRGGDYSREDPEGSRCGGEGSGEGSMGRGDAEVAHVPRTRSEPDNRKEVYRQDLGPGPEYGGEVAAGEVEAQGVATKAAEFRKQREGIVFQPLAAADASP